MCGICGYVSKSRLDTGVLSEMNGLMLRRGPDDAGIETFVGEDWVVGLAQRRLAIFDLSDRGHQPMVSDDGKYAIVYNGEVYNFRQLRTELEEDGVVFQSNCDTEVLLQAYRIWGDCMLQRLTGMFAFAILDRENKRMLLARDRMGQKPLYYYHFNGLFIFASELKPIMHHPEFKKNIRKDVLCEYLCNRSVCSPNTIFENTWKVCPGQQIVLDSQGVHASQYWDLTEKYIAGADSTIDDFEQIKYDLGRIIHDSIQARLAADVPIGVFLSGGIDSTTIAAFASQISEQPIKTFTIGFYDQERNEAPEAKRISEYLGTQHTEMYVSDDDILKMVSDIPRCYDEPFSDSSQIPTMLVSRLAREHVTVALSGDGGDEVFCGYSMYDWAKRAQKMEPLAKLAYDTVHLPGIDRLHLDKLIPKYGLALVNNRAVETKTQCFIELKQTIASSILLHDTYGAKYAVEARYTKVEDWQARRMLVDMHTYLPDEVLAKMDRASMWHSLEARCPLIDHHVVEYAFRIPHRYKYHDGVKKYVLKQVLYDYVPKQLLDMPKRGFGVPLAKWLRGPLKPLLEYYSQPERILRQELFDSTALSQLFAKLEKSNNTIYSTVVWSYLVFQLWYNEYIERTI